MLDNSNSREIIVLITFSLGVSLVTAFIEIDRINLSKNSFSNPYIIIENRNIKKNWFSYGITSIKIGNTEKVKY